MSEYSDLMDKMYALAEEKGKHSNEAWLDIDGVYWPNPYYKGKPVLHPESDSVFHPTNAVSLKERMQNYQESRE